MFARHKACGSRYMCEGNKTKTAQSFLERSTVEEVVVDTGVAVMVRPVKLEAALAEGKKDAERTLVGYVGTRCKCLVPSGY